MVAQLPHTTACENTVRMKRRRRAHLKASAAAQRTGSDGAYGFCLPLFCLCRLGSLSSLYSLCSFGLSRLVLPVQLVRSVQLVQPRDIAIVAIELLMMEVVERRLVIMEHPWPVISAMMRLRAQDGVDNPYEDCVSMG